jgi:hypothetical protein
LVEEFIAQYRRGERPTISEVCRQASPVGRVDPRPVPALAAIERLKPDDADQTDSPGEATSSRSPRPDCVGDYSPMILIFGISHIAQPRLWADFFIAMGRTGFARLIIGMYTLPTAMILVVGHNKWTWDWPLFITLSGWVMLLKCLVYLLYPKVSPEVADRWIALMDRKHRGFQVVGAIMVIFGGILTWQAFLGPFSHASLTHAP